jgi:hypothetical protein
MAIELFKRPTVLFSVNGNGSGAVQTTNSEKSKRNCTVSMDRNRG